LAVIKVDGTIEPADGDSWPTLEDHFLKPVDLAALDPLERIEAVEGTVRYLGPTPCRIRDENVRLPFPEPVKAPRENNFTGPAH
jgi:hypothetical protein